MWTRALGVWDGVLPLVLLSCCWWSGFSDSHLKVQRLDLCYFQVLVWGLIAFPPPGSFPEMQNLGCFLCDWTRTRVNLMSHPGLEAGWSGRWLQVVVFGAAVTSKDPLEISAPCSKADSRWWSLPHWPDETQGQGHTSPNPSHFMVGK